MSSGCFVEDAAKIYQMIEIQECMLSMHIGKKSMLSGILSFLRKPWLADLHLLKRKKGDGVYF